MHSAKAIEKAVKELPKDELSKFRNWFVKFDEAAWDAQIEADAVAGKLDALAAAALDEHRSGNSREL